MYMEEWNMGDKIYKEDGTTPSLIKHEQVQEPIRHYTLMNHNHNYIANGCLSGTREMKKIKVEDLYKNTNIKTKDMDAILAFLYAINKVEINDEWVIRID